MNASYLDSVGKALDQLPCPVDLFFRDDDAGWEDHRLLQLLDVFARHELPIDLAAIPKALTPSLSHELLSRMNDVGSKVRLHQHGYAHVNHETAGRKCEFGPSRVRAAQKRDIAEGILRLQELMGANIDSIFTPPWNRCTADTGECLVELGFRALSREAGATPLGNPHLAELPINQDWFAHRKGTRLTRPEWGKSLADKLRSRQPIGIMFHHAVMDPQEMELMAELLALLGAHPNARCRPMSQFIVS